MLEKLALDGKVGVVTGGGGGLGKAISMALKWIILNQRA